MNSTGTWISFDCYGTLIDWRTGMRGALAPVFADRTEAVLEAYYRLELDVQQASYRPYREVLAEGLRLAADSAGVPCPEENVLADAWPALPFFADVPAALEGLRAQGVQVAILTNCDDDLWRTTEMRFPVAIDEVVTAQAVKSYKPSHGHFQEFRRRRDPAPEHWVHAACSWVHDIVPASELGVPSIWIDWDRTGQDPARATAVLPDATALAETAARLLAT